MAASGSVSGAMNFVTWVPDFEVSSSPRACSFSSASRKEGRETSSLSASSRSGGQLFAGPQRAFENQLLKMFGDGVGQLEIADGLQGRVSRFGVLRINCHTSIRKTSVHTRLSSEKISIMKMWSNKNTKSK